MVLGFARILSFREDILRLIGQGRVFSDHVWAADVEPLSGYA